MQYFYLIWALVFFLVWTLVFSYRKDVRPEMLTMSWLFGLGGLLSEKTYTIDWWQPITITHSRIGIEDFVIGFCIGGIASVIYEEVYKKHLSKRKTYAIGQSPNYILFLISFPLVYFFLFYLFHLGSFLSSVITYSLGIGYMLYLRRDLANNALLSGIFMLLIGIGIYSLLFFVNPDYIKEFWFLPKQWYSASFLRIPIGEYIWYFLTGAFIGPLYEFIKNYKLSGINNPE
jgi:hypothetical protein